MWNPLQAMMVLARINRKQLGKIIHTLVITHEGTYALQVCHLICVVFSAKRCCLFDGHGLSGRESIHGNKSL